MAIKYLFHFVCDAINVKSFLLFCFCCGVILFYSSLLVGALISSLSFVTHGATVTLFVIILIFCTPLTEGKKLGEKQQ